MSARIPRTLHTLSALSRPAVAARPAIGARFASSDASGSKPAPPKVDSAATPTPEPVTKPAKKGGKGDKDKDADPYAVPPLSRPLGVPVRPTSAALTWQQKKELMLDAERHKAKRQALFKEASQGYFHDYNLARKANGGKLWIAPPVLIREDRALYFPDIAGKALTGAETHTSDLFPGKVSLVSVLNTRISEEHVQGFVEPVLEDWEGSPHFRYIQINHQDNPLKSMLVSFFVSSLKRTIPKERWDSYLIASGEWSEIDIRRPLGMENKLLGYVFLVDQNGKVRWAGCGASRPEEVEHLRRSAAVLVRRMAGEQ